MIGELMGEAARSGGAGSTTFSEGVAHALAVAAANAGQLDVLTPDADYSHVAHLVRQVAITGIGRSLIAWRTTPIVIPLNLPELAAKNPAFPSMRDALEAVDQWCRVQAEVGGDCRGWQARREEVRQAWLDAYRKYAEEFCEAARVAALRLDGLRCRESGGLRVDLHFAVTVDPDQPSSQWATPNPTPDAADRLCWRLWSDAWKAVPLPAPPCAVTDPCAPGSRIGPVAARAGV